MALAGLFLVFSIAFAPHPAVAAPADDLGCADGKTEDYRFAPQDFPEDAKKIRPKSLALTVGSTTFRFDSLRQQDRGGGLDSWDFLFKPASGNTSGLSFVFRNDPGNGGGFGYVIDGPAGDGIEPANKVCNLVDFHKSALGEFLKARSDAEGIEWAKEGGITTDVEQTSLLERASDDPFAQALAKLAEVVSSLAGSVTDALLWAMDVGDLGKNQGLAEGWKIVRDIVNLLFVLVLSGLALTSIIRVDPQKYNVRGLLPLLVFSVLAVNFSFLFANILANTALILSQPFAEQTKQMIESWSGVGSGFASGLADGFGEGVVLLLASIIILVALVILLFFFIIRIVVIWVLAVLSPVLFLFLVLPFTRGESKSLLQTYIRWVYLAPIAFLLLYIGSLMLEAILTGTDTGRSGATAIIQALFFAGVVITAIAVPLALGGRIASMAAGQGKRAGGIGAKGGLGAATMLPTGGGHTLGERIRQGKAAHQLRKSGQEERAQEEAATGLVRLNEALGGGGVATSITGFDAGQAQPILNDQVDKQLKRAMLGGMNEANFMRMVGHSMSQKSNLSADEQALIGNIHDRYGDASLEEQRMASNHVGERAAVKGLAQSGFLEWNMLPRYAGYGYQEAMGKYDPLMSAVRKTYRGGPIEEQQIDMERVGVALASASADDQKSYVPGFWRSVEPGSEFGRRATPGALGSFRDTVHERSNVAALSAIMDPTNRVAASDTRREAIAAVRGTLRPEARDAVELSDRNPEALRRGFRRFT